MIDGEVLGTRIIDELLALVDRGDTDDGVRLTAERERLRGEVARLVGSIASGVPADTVAPAIKEREAEIARIDAQLRTPREVRPNIEKLREALEQRAAQWKTDLRAEPQVARLLLRRLVGPLTLWDDADGLRWDAPVTTGLLDGLVHVGTSPAGFEPALPA